VAKARVSAADKVRTISSAMKGLMPLLAAAGLMLDAGCSSAPALPKPTSSRTLILSPKDRQLLYLLPLWTELKVILPRPEGGPEFSWAVLANNNKVLQQTRMLTPLSKPTDDQAYSATFQSVNRGRSTLRFAAIKEGQAESEPSDLYQIAIGVKSVQ